MENLALDYISESSRFEMSDDVFDSFSDLIYNRSGIHLPPVKKTMLSVRLSRRLKKLGIKNFADYYNVLSHPEHGENEIVSMLDEVSTNKTDFFRESSHFDYLKEVVLPDILSRKGGKSERINIWSAGCSSGEEPYTIAMVCAGFFKYNFNDKFLVYATDISTKVLTAAVSAVYEEKDVENIPEFYRNRYVMRGKDKTRNGKYKIAPEIRETVVFARRNLMENQLDMNERFDIIFCRNVIIYFDNETKKKVFKSFYDNLAPKGYLFIGHSETLNTLNYNFKMVEPTVYVKRSM